MIFSSPIILRMVALSPEGNDLPRPVEEPESRFADFPELGDAADIKIGGGVCTQLCPNIFNSLDCSLPGSSVHGIFQARIVEWAAIPYSRGSARPRDCPCVSCVSCVGRWVLDCCVQASKLLLAASEPFTPLVGPLEVCYLFGCSMWDLHSS